MHLIVRLTPIDLVEHGCHVFGNTRVTAICVAQGCLDSITYTGRFYPVFGLARRLRVEGSQGRHVDQNDRD